MQWGDEYQQHLAVQSQIGHPGPIVAIDIDSLDPDVFKNRSIERVWTLDIAQHPIPIYVSWAKVGPIADIGGWSPIHKLLFLGDI